MRGDFLLTEKKKLRREMIAQRERLTPEQQREESILICRKVVDHHFFKQSQTILFYMPVRGEVDVRPAIEAAWKQGKRVALPRVERGAKNMTLWFVDSYLQLEEGVYGILEPKKREEARVTPSELDLVIVPGVAFDVDGYRIGYGGGYYDRFFAKWESLVRLGVGYSFQVVSTVYPEDHDQPLHGLITSEQVMMFQ